MKCTQHKWQDYDRPCPSCYRGDPTPGEATFGPIQANANGTPGTVVNGTIYPRGSPGLPRFGYIEAGPMKTGSGSFAVSSKPVPAFLRRPPTLRQIALSDSLWPEQKAHLLAAADAVDEVLKLLLTYGDSPSEQGKAWVIDQVARTLLGSDYKAWVADAEDEGFEWYEGIAP